MKQSTITLGGSQDANMVHDLGSSTRVRSLTTRAVAVDVVDILKWGRMKKSMYVGWI